MASLTYPLRNQAVPDRVADFVRAKVDTSPRRSLSGRKVEVRYRLRSIDGAESRDLAADPTIVPSPPVARLIVNTMGTFALVLVAGLIIAAVAPRLFGYESVVVVSGSMEPGIRVADVVVTAPTDGTNLAEGSVINFDHEDGTRLHRISAVEPDGVYRTAGDANQTPDSGTVAPAEVRGVGVVVVPFVGLPATWLQRGEWLPLGLSIAALLAAAYVSRSSWVTKNTPAIAT